VGGGDFKIVCRRGTRKTSHYACDGNSGFGGDGGGGGRAVESKYVVVIMKIISHCTR